MVLRGNPVLSTGKRLIEDKNGIFRRWHERLNLMVPRCAALREKDLP